MRNRPGPTEGMGEPTARAGFNGQRAWGMDADDRPRHWGEKRDRSGRTQTRPKATLLVQILSLATGWPGREECHSMLLPA